MLIILQAKEKSEFQSNLQNHSLGTQAVQCQEAKWKLAEMIVGLIGGITLYLILTVSVGTLLKIHLFVHSKKNVFGACCGPGYVLDAGPYDWVGIQHCVCPSRGWHPRGQD